MSTITQLVAQKKNNERISVFVDNEFFCGLTVDDAVKNNLVVGLDLSEAELSRLLSIAGENDMFNKALVYILRAPRTESEVRRFLSRKKDCSDEMTGRIINRLKTMNYINDEAYAKMFAATKHVKMSIRAIKHKLRTKGIKNEYVDEVTENAGSQNELAHSIAEKYMRYREYDRNNLQRLFRYLVAKGFEYDTANEIIREYKSKHEIDPEIKAEFFSKRNDYKQARVQVKDAKRNAKSKKKNYKELKKKVTGEIR